MELAPCVRLFLSGSRKLILLLFISSTCCCTIVFGQGNHTNTPLHRDTLAAGKQLTAGKDLADEGQFNAAMSMIEKAKLTYLYHEQWEQGIECLITLALIADNIDPLSIKFQYAEEAIQLCKMHLAADHSLLASAFRQKAEAFSLNGQVDSVDDYLHLAIPILNQQQQWDDVAWCEIILGLNFLNQYQLDSCNYHFQMVKDLISQEVLSQNAQPDIEATLLNLQGVQYELQGDYDRAIHNTKQALALDLSKPELSAVDSTYISTYYLNLGAFYFIKGDNQRALNNYTQAIYSFKEAANDPILLNNISELYKRQKNYTQAIDYAQKSLALTKGKEDQKQSQFDALLSLITIYRESNQNDKALEIAQEAIGFEPSYGKYLAWATLGLIHINMDQPLEALKNIDIAAKVYKEDSMSLKRNPFFYSRIHHLTAQAHFLNQDANRALHFYQQALLTNHATFRDSLNYFSNPDFQGIYDPIYFLETIQEKAKILASFEDQNKRKAALDTYHLTFQWIDTLFNSYHTEASQLDWSNTFKPMYEKAIQVAYSLYQDTKDLKYLEEAFSFSEKSKNAILLETLKSKESIKQTGVPDSLIKKEKDLNLDIAFYEKVLRKAQDQKEEDKIKLYQQYLSKTRLDLASLKDELEKDYPKFQAWKNGNQAMTITKVQTDLLDKQTAFLEYFLGDEKAFVFVITKTSAMLIPLEASSKVIDQASKNFRTTLLDLQTFKQNAKVAFTDYQQKSTRLYQHILQAPLDHLSKNIQQLILVPDGLLNTIPFEAVTKPSTLAANLDFATLPYLLYDFNFQYAYSADLLLKNQNRQHSLPANANCLAFAPSYQSHEAIAHRGNLDQLRSINGQLIGTGQEVNAIANFFDGQFETGNTATEDQFKKLADQFGILHLAMHGIIDLDNSNFNHLKFSNLATDSLEDNLLYHYEVANMDLSAQLVVLSACETGLGKYEKGEGTFSLARSFMYAGVPSVVMSLWKVSDASTSELMPYFYKNLADHQAKDQALHQAKKDFLRESDLEYKHPFYWSAFVIMGDSQAIQSGTSNWHWWLLAGLILLGLGWITLKRK